LKNIDFFLCLAPLSAVFQLYHGDQWWKRTTDHGQATGKLYLSRKANPAT